jgi:uncharacterized membrane protein YfcA
MQHRHRTTVLVLLTLLAVSPAFAGTTGTEFQTMYTTLLNWATGFLGKSIAIAAFILGAGIGILMLATLGLLGLGDIHKLNAVKNVLGTLINGAAALLFAVGSFAGSHAVSWPHAAVMAASAVAGGFAGATVARRLPARVVRRTVALIAFTLAGFVDAGALLDTSDEGMDLSWRLNVRATPASKKKNFG